MIVGEVIDISQKGRSSSHGSLQQAVKREDISDNESDNYDGQTPCSLCKQAQEPCSTPARSGIPISSPSECTCNRVFFDLCSACLPTTTGMPPDYGEWAKTCRNHSLNMSEKYPSQKASRVILPSLAVPADASDPTSKAKVASAILVARASETAGVVPIVVPIAVVLGLAALVALLAYICWIKRSRREETFGAFLRRRCSFRRIQEISSRARGRDFVIDQQSENTNDFIMINPEPGLIGVHSWASLGHLNPRQPEYSFPLKTVWRNSSHIVQQFRRIPDIVPHPWGSHAVHIRPSQPGRRFRVDPSGSTEESNSSAMISQQSTVEGAIPATIIEDEEDVDSTYHASCSGEEEHSSLIRSVDRLDNEVFLISNRPYFSVPSSSNSHSSNSHHFKIIPPTPTESSRSHGGLSQMILPTMQIRRPIDIPPAPQRPAPVPPRSSPRRPSPLHNQAESSVYQPLYNATTFSRENLPQAQVVSQSPNPPRSVSPLPGGSQQFIPLNIPVVSPLLQHSPNLNILANPDIAPRSVTPPQPGFLSSPPIAPLTQLTPLDSYNVQRRPSAEGNDPNHVPRRPMGARLPSSHKPRRPSIDEEVSRFGPAIPSGDSIHLMSPPRSPARPLTPQLPQSPHARQRSLPASSDDVAAPPVLSPPRSMHARTLSSESLNPVPDDSRLFYSGPVHTGAYSVYPRPNATGSFESLHSRPLPKERAH